MGNIADIDEVFATFDEVPIAGASLGQVHRGTLKDGTQVAVKVQRAGLKELFDVDLKNLEKFAKLLDKFDPKSDGADRSYDDIFNESARLLYEEINYELEAKNTERFREQFADTPWVRIPKVYTTYSTERILTMEYVESFKLTDIARVEKEGLDKKELANRVADSFLKQIVTTGYFHCDPHPGNLCVDTSGNLVYYEYGMMDELKPNVKAGFKQFCFALFEGGPFVSDIALGKSAKKLVNAVEEAGVLAKGANRFACEKLARYFIRSFKDTQAGRAKKSLKQTVGADVQALTDANVFRFPSTFTFIFRALASIDGIGKGLDKDFDLGKLSQPFVERLIEKTDYEDEFQKFIGTSAKATGLNVKDINLAVSQPKKIAYLEETVRAMETGDLRIRVRSLENETAIERLTLKADSSESLIVASLFANAAFALSPRPLKLTASALAIFFGAKTLGAKAKLKIYDKKQSRFEKKTFEDA